VAVVPGERSWALAWDLSMHRCRPVFEPTRNRFPHQRQFRTGHPVPKRPIHRSYQHCASQSRADCRASPAMCPRPSFHRRKDCEPGHGAFPSIARLEYPRARRGYLVLRFWSRNPSSADRLLRKNSTLCRRFHHQLGRIAGGFQVLHHDRAGSTDS